VFISLTTQYVEKSCECLLSAQCFYTVDGRNAGHLAIVEEIAWFASCLTLFICTVLVRTCRELMTQIVLNRFTLVMFRYIENIEISVRYRYIVSHRITRGNIEIFDIPVSTFRYHLAEFSRVVSRSRENFIETFTEFFYCEKIS